MPSDTTLNHMLVALCEHIASSDKPIIINYQTAKQWHLEAIELFLKHKLICSASSAQSIQCSGCEKHCFMDVITRKYESTTRVFIMCEDAEMQSQMGRIEIHIEHLKQSRSSTKHLAAVIARLLDLGNHSEQNTQGKIRLGMMKSSKGRRWVSLQFEPLALEINQYLSPIAELLYFEDEQLFIDIERIDELLERTPQSNDKKYSPSTDKREQRKLETQAMYQDWKDEYLKRKRVKPSASDSMISKQIAKIDIAQGKDSETIRKNMK